MRHARAGPSHGVIHTRNGASWRLAAFAALHQARARSRSRDMMVGACAAAGGYLFSITAAESQRLLDRMLQTYARSGLPALSTGSKIWEWDVAQNVFHYAGAVFVRRLFYTGNCNKLRWAMFKSGCALNVSLPFIIIISSRLLGLLGQ